jgi:hypothetical protein
VAAQPGRRRDEEAAVAARRIKDGERGRWRLTIGREHRRDDVLDEGERGVEGAARPEVGPLALGLIDWILSLSLQASNECNQQVVIYEHRCRPRKSRQIYSR